MADNDFIKCDKMLVVETRDKAVLVRVGVINTIPPVALNLWWPLNAVQIEGKHVVAVKGWTVKSGQTRYARLG